MASSRPALGGWFPTLASALVASLLVACSGPPTTSASTRAPTTAVSTTATPTTATPTTGRSTTSSITVAPTTTVGTTTSVVLSTAAGAAGPAYTATMSAVTAADLGSSWRPGCPVAPDDLRLLRLSYWGFDDQSHVGSLVVAASAASAVLEAFRTLHDQHFPIRRMEPVDAYGADDDASMASDNTSAFNCRPAVSDGPVHWSNHAYGLAVDVNPVENPYLLGGRVLPPAGADFVDRAAYRPGMAVAGGALTSAFASIGWGWGGVWDSPDYQHFSSTGG